MSYSWSSFGREAEYVAALYLKSAGWPDVRLSPGSRGPADIIASRQAEKWYIQVKASSGIPRLKGREVRALIKLAGEHGGRAVVCTVSPLSAGAFSTGNYSVAFYQLASWAPLDPTGFQDSTASAALRSRARSPERDT